MCADLNLPLLGKVPLDPRIAQSCDEGRSFLDVVPDSPAAKVYRSIVQSEYFQEYIRKHFPVSVLPLSLSRHIVGVFTFLGKEVKHTSSEVHHYF